MSARTELGRRGRSLDDLADAIGREWQLFEASARTTVGHAVRVGELLAEAKAQLTHGAWLPWLKQNTDISERTAQRWMQLARARAENPTAMSGMGVKEALGAIATPRAPRTAPAELGTAAEPAPESEAGAPAPDAGAELRRAGVDAEVVDDLVRTSVHVDRFPRPGVERKAMREIVWGLASVARSITDAKVVGHSDWTRGEYLRKAAIKARALAVELDQFAAMLIERFNER